MHPVWRRHQGKTTNGRTMDHGLYSMPGEDGDRDGDKTLFIAFRAEMNQRRRRKADVQLCTAILLTSM
jgi:hypothetical protein